MLTLFTILLITIALLGVAVAGNLRRGNIIKAYEENLFSQVGKDRFDLVNVTAEQMRWIGKNHHCGLHALYVNGSFWYDNRYYRIATNEKTGEYTIQLAENGHWKTTTMPITDISTEGSYYISKGKVTQADIEVTLRKIMSAAYIYHGLRFSN